MDEVWTINGHTCSGIRTLSKSICKRTGMNLQQIGAASGFDRVKISNVFSGKLPITWKTLVKLEKALPLLPTDRDMVNLRLLYLVNRQRTYMDWRCYWETPLMAAIKRWERALYTSTITDPCFPTRETMANALGTTPAFVGNVMKGLKRGVFDTQSLMDAFPKVPEKDTVLLKGVMGNEQQIFYQEKRSAYPPAVKWDPRTPEDPPVYDYTHDTGGAEQELPLSLKYKEIYDRYSPSLLAECDQVYFLPFI